MLKRTSDIVVATNTGSHLKSFYVANLKYSIQIHVRTYTTLSVTGPSSKIKEVICILKNFTTGKYIYKIFFRFSSTLD